MAAENLDNMSLEALTAILNSNVSELSKLEAELEFLTQMENKMAEPKAQPMGMQEQQPMATPASAPAPAQQPMAMPMDEFGMGLTPDAIQQATAKLVEAGMFTETTSQITPEVLQDMQILADMLSPGLFDLSQPDELEEFINGINDGTIPLVIPSRTAGAAPAGGAIPGAGAIPAGTQPGSALGGAAPAGGAIPAGAGAAPAPII